MNASSYLISAIQIKQEKGILYYLTTTAYVLKLNLENWESQYRMFAAPIQNPLCYASPTINRDKRTLFDRRQVNSDHGAALKGFRNQSIRLCTA